MLPIELMKILENADYLVELGGEDGSLVASFPERILQPVAKKSKIKYTCLDNGLQISDNSNESLDKSLVVPCPVYATRALAECDILAICSAIGYSVEGVKIGLNNEDAISSFLKFPDVVVPVSELEEQEEKILKCIKLCSTAGLDEGEAESKRLDVYEGFKAIRDYIKDIYDVEE